MVKDVAKAETESRQVEAAIAEVCGLLNAATGRLVRLIAEVLATDAWEGWGIRSPEHWVSWKCGVSSARARSLVAMAKRLEELPETVAAFEAGELSEDQVSVVCRHAPSSIDGQAAELARAATVTQLRRVLGSYTFERPATDASESSEEPRQVSFGYTDDGAWRLSALLPSDEGALLERALTDARKALVKTGEKDASWSDALIAVAERSLTGGTPTQSSATVFLHLDADGSHLHLGPAVSDGMRRFLTCDSRIRAVLKKGGTAVSLGRASRTVPDRTRTIIEERDRGCRVPGCSRTRWLHVHHIEHWENGGATDTPNLIALCSKHHRLHHLGQLGVSGNADEPDGVVFTDRRGRRLPNCSSPRPPSATLNGTAAQLGLVIGEWRHPTGEPLDIACIYFNETAGDSRRGSAPTSHRVIPTRLTIPA